MNIQKINQMMATIDQENEKWLSLTGTPQENAENHKKELEFALAAILLDELYNELPLELKKEILSAKVVAASACRYQARDFNSKIQEEV